jgi:hypothetical protein
MTVRYEEIKPVTANDEDYCILDEGAEFFDPYVVQDPRQRDAAVLVAAATWAGGPDGAWFTIPRVLWTSEESAQEETGKTLAMTITANLSANPEDASGTYAALRSALAEAGATPENSLRTFYLDEVGDEIFGAAGTNRGGNPVFTKLAKKGYKRGAFDSYSRQGTKVKFSLFHFVYMTSKDVALPRDLRGRTIVMYMKAGTPKRYFSAREGEQKAKDLGMALGREVQEHMQELADFRALGYHPRLTKRRLEVWEPLFAIAKVLGGQRWLNRCMQAFLMLALDTNQTALSPRERILRDADGLAAKVQRILPDGREFTPGLALAGELKRLGTPYSDKSDLAICGDLAEAMPLAPKQVRVGTEVIRGYWTRDIRYAWETVRPKDPEDVEDPEEEENPFAVTDVTDTVFDAVFENKPQPATVTASRQSRKK